MGEKFGNHFDVNTAISPFIPRGRGVSTNSLCTGEPTSTVSNGSHSRMAFDNARGVGRGLLFQDPPVQHHVEHTSTPRSTNCDSQILDCLTDMFGRLGEQISDAVAAKIIENGTMTAKP